MEICCSYVTVVVRKVDALVKWRRSLFEESPAFSSKPGALVEEHIHTIHTMETIQGHILRLTVNPIKTLMN